ncbi:hypothetical protein [Terribacillus saccharophilus]|uniref:Uncharacterized protein n=1 Tax=Terribacillus saccharophilus TaxID=361277 RepID=A0A075LPR8_9BACI|nr:MULTISPECIES: hypothetical protein [Terribacillus]AIF68349.1 hypothetical protein GZ22_18040 [Terribacillus goriensis]MCM3227483.1 hypothetical protein [Terribacillus saccharophilus]
MTRKTWMYLFIMLTGLSIGVYNNFTNIGTLLLMTVLIAAAVIMILFNLSVWLKNRSRKKQ